MADFLAMDVRQADVPIAAVGASAGGITALQKLFERLPVSIPFALVVLQHLPADKTSGLANLIARWTRLPVRAATDGTRPVANCVYVPSPDRILTLEDGVFRTRPAEGGERRPGIDTIDSFLESLSQREAPRSLAVILSGTGMDGAAGALRIRQAGGVVIVQDPLTALYDGMPNAVIQRGIHDHILPLAAIGQQLVACADPAYVRPVPSGGSAVGASETLGRIIELVRQRAGFDLSGYKPSPLLWRIQQRMDAREIWSFDDYAYLIEDDPVELEVLVRGIPIHVTEFFRDADAWTVLRDEVLGPIVSRHEKQRTVRVWTPACSTGEEAYSVAMLLDEMSQERAEPFDFQVFATDAAPELVARASRGLFRVKSLAGVSEARQSQYFYKVDGAFRVKRCLREKLVCVPQDLISDPPFSGLDLVTCRNLFIYLESETVRTLLSVLHGALRVGGVLFLGKSEAYPLAGQGFEVVSSKWNIYRKVGPMPGGGRMSSVPRPASNGQALAAALRVAHEQFDVPSVLIDDTCSVLRTYGNTKGILRLPAGEPSLDLTELVPRQWAARLEHGVRQVLERHEAIVLTGLHDGDANSAAASVRLTPLQTSSGDARDRILVSFIREDDTLDALQADGSSVLQDDLGMDDAIDWKDEARISREEVEASHEELLALNEELKASNEQLNQSNEDLDQANVELQENIAQLAMQSRVLLSGAVMTLLLDAELKLRWFTPSMRDLFPLRDNDTGRSIADLVPIFRDPDFYTDIRRVLDAADPREAVIRNGGGRCLLRKIFPYVAQTGVIDGVAITFADITDRVHAEVALRRNEAWLSAQKEAFQAAMNGERLGASLGVLIRTLAAQAQDGRRCAFYIADGDVLHHVVGMPDAYAQCVDGFRISPESLACGLAVATGEPVITRDVLDEPRWRSWTWLAKKFGYRGCWSFPVETSEGNLVGSLAMYFDEPRGPSPMDLDLAAAFTQTAGIIIWRYLQSGQIREL
ncbi:signal transduction histidine kinase with CheB and CheR activity [Caballeronia fortuita]|uniref:protein-glutamate O-methyltransferase n=1 Tax=Caballeronia fortuita TaxID=1777138 RepID=A0A158DZX4_9BURK|nr:chemotaxis protein CheB [Caballeronia fortuita]SAK99766.1 signal transduction histidine kinase with CheB and CheR activity [Caballeronia fortuita]